ncbi:MULTISPECIES: hypothetical protein [Phyllobacteriaceae]
MENTNLAEQKDTYTRAFPLTDFRTERDEERFDIRPSDRTADRPVENLL